MGSNGSIYFLHHTIQQQNVTKLRLTHSLLFVLITAFLSMQWSVAHIHLEGHHDHGEAHHQHQVEAHAHHALAQHASSHSNSQHHIVANHHPDTIDSANVDIHINVVELDHDCNATNGKIKTPANAVIASIIWQSTRPLTSTFHQPHFANIKASYLEQSSIQLRAPPLRA